MVETTHICLISRNMAAKSRGRMYEGQYTILSNKYMPSAAKSVFNFPLDNYIVKMELEALLSLFENSRMVT